MDTRDIAQRFGLDKAAFDKWVESSDILYRRRTFGGIDLQDGQNFSEIVGRFKTEYEEQLRISEREEALMKEAEAEARLTAERQAEEKQRALSGMLITSGFNFDGYTITKYSGYISGDNAISVDRPSHGFWGNTNGDVGADLLAALTQIRRNALAELKEAAYALGCNAVIGVDFDYLTLDPETATNQGGTLYLPFLFAVTANGNAVIIDKNN
jgi:uncharacterized protein YbjQ (UPF0145 family)